MTFGLLNDKHPNNLEINPMASPKIRSAQASAFFPIVPLSIFFNNSDRSSNLFPGLNTSAILLLAIFYGIWTAQRQTSGMALPSVPLLVLFQRLESVANQSIHCLRLTKCKLSTLPSSSPSSLALSIIHNENRGLCQPCAMTLKASPVT